jgi:DNA-binding NarL/FixJ family response regulator
MRILVIDSETTGRKFVRRMVEENTVHEVVGESADVSDVVEVAARLRPDVAVLCFPAGFNHHRLVSDLTSGASVAVILVTTGSVGSSIWRGMAQGVSGYLLKDRLVGELSLALAATEAGGVFVSPPLVRHLISYLALRLGEDAHSVDANEIRRVLLPRERETLHRLAAGQSTEEIAVEMAVTTPTVRVYVSRVLRKLDLRSRGEAIALAYRSGFYLSVGRWIESFETNQLLPGAQDEYESGVDDEHARV